MPALLTEVFLETVEVVGAVFALMVAVELVNVRLQGRLARLVVERPWASYAIAALLGVIPGCEGEFLAVTLYSHGALSFGALLACMLATTGDEGLTILRLVPSSAAVLFPLMATIGALGGWVADRVWNRFGPPRAICEEIPHHPGHESLAHFFKEHVVRHVVGKHLPRIFLWTFAALLVTAWAKPYLVPEEQGGVGPGALLGIGALVGLIPSSGPHLLFVALLAKGVAPFSVLLANSLSQTGHGVLPLLHTSWRLVLLVKAITLFTGLLIGGLAMVAGY